MSAIVLDCSVAVAWAFAEERDAAVEQLLDRVIDDGALVPALWPFEVANTLLMAVRRGRLTAAQVPEFTAMLLRLPIRVDAPAPARVLGEVRALAESHRLTAYDAAYLELAMREGATLASKDRALCAAAERLGVAVIPV